MLNSFFILFQICSQLTQVEAEFYELKSKYIYVLQEISKPQLGIYLIFIIKHKD